MRNKIISGLVLVLAILAVFLFTRSDRSEEISNERVGAMETGTVKENGGYRTLSTDAVPESHPNYDFSFSILEDWRVEAVKENSSLNIYDPGVEADTRLEQSRIFIRHFVANNFQTLDSVNILSRIERDINGREVVTYVIAKKESADDFANQPSWRNKTHKAVDIRLSTDNPTVFYVFAKSPEISDGEFERFLDSIIFN